MKPGRRIPGGIEFNHTSELVAKFRRNTTGVLLHRFHVIGLDRASECGRTVVLYWKTIDDELRLVFRFTRMQDAIGFEGPSRLLDREINETASWRTHPPFFNLL